jgi:hydroxymethylbilane synthase
MKMRPDLNVRPIRGNVETRVKKVVSGEYGAVVLAEAGLSRIGMEDMIVERFEIAEFMPAPGQGAIAIVCRKNDDEVAKMLKTIEDSQSRSEVMAERALIEKVEGGCRFPLGAIAVTSKDRMTLHASVFSADGRRQIKASKTDMVGESEKLGGDVADLLIEQGAAEMAEGWRTAVQEWNSRL